MAALNMGGLTPLQIKSELPDGKWYVNEHTVGVWGHILVTSTLYKMRGYNESTLEYEYWVTNNPNSGPPTGANLSNKVIAAVLADPNFPVIA